MNSYKIIIDVIQQTCNVIDVDFGGKTKHNCFDS